MPTPSKGCLVQIHPLDVHGGLIRVRDSGFNIGRDVNSHFVIRDESVSRRHACIERTEAGYVVTDKDSTNGTFVNETRITTCPLQAGDRLRLANHIFKFLSADHIEAQYHETVYSMMTKDGLTGIYNKRYFTDLLEREVERSRRFNRPLSLILFDIDHFKQVNDKYGHLAGDEVLQELSRRVTSVIRRDELVARYGGEEFAMVLAETDLEGAVTMAERLRQVVANDEFQTANEQIPVTVSVGVAVRDNSNDFSSVELIAAADEKLYEAKQTGRNRSCS